MNDIALRTQTLSAGYEGKAVLTDVSFAVRAGEILALIGPNGAGKSTLLKTVAGLLPPVKGSVVLNGTPLSETDRQTIAKTLAIVTTGRIQAERMTCADVVANGRYPYTGRLGVLSERDHAAVSEAMSLVHVTELAERPFSKISDGQRQRVMLARAICQEPGVLVMDEPTSFLDVNHKISFFTLLKQLVKDRRIAVVLSLHEIELASHVCDTVLCLRDGRADRTGPPKEILTEDYIEDLFGMTRGAYHAFFSGGRPDAEPSGRVRRGEDGAFYVNSGTEKLRIGFTTGTCAALAASGAAKTLLQGEKQTDMRLLTPAGIPVSVTLIDVTLDETGASCAVRKDSGDDPDVTNGCLVQAHVRKIPEGIVIEGGNGVGRVTKPGLDRPVGEAAINTGPRNMITNALEAVASAARYDGGFHVTISVPDGEQLAAKTFNPMLGVEGGISILGTSGIVEPMSEQALVDTIRLEIRQAKALHATGLILTPGNYGADFLRENGFGELGMPVVKCSNYIGEALDIAAAEGFEEVLLIGHIGKLVKLAGGIMQTHSRQADCRTELFCAHAALAGADVQTCQALADAATTDACIEILDRTGLRDEVIRRLLVQMDAHLARRAAGAFQSGAVVFSNRYGMFGETEGAKAIINARKADGGNR